VTPISPGLTNETTRIVERRHLASEWGSGLAPVLATPALVAFCEECARLAVDPLLPSGQQTVGTWINLRHMAATPLGLRVTVQAELKEVDERRLRFQIVAWDDAEQIGEAEHERFVIDVARFQQRMTEKAASGQEKARQVEG
jgi:fluoroacetyl-CoA thioesterase